MSGGTILWGTTCPMTPKYCEICQFENGLTPAGLAPTSSCSFFERKILHFPVSCAASTFPATAFLLWQLLEDISSYMKDFTALRAAQVLERAAQLKKAHEDKQKGEEMRRAAMEGISCESACYFMFNLLNYMC